MLVVVVELLLQIMLAMLLLAILELAKAVVVTMAVLIVAVVIVAMVTVVVVSNNADGTIDGSSRTVMLHNFHPPWFSSICLPVVQARHIII